MKRLEAMAAVYDRLTSCIVVTIMGAVAAELQSLGHRPNFFYLQHAMGLASSVGLGIALIKQGEHFGFPLPENTAGHGPHRTRYVTED